MEKNESHSKRQLQLMLSALQIQVELHDHKRFKLAEGVEQIAGLIRAAMNSRNGDVKSALEKVLSILTPSHKLMLEKHGVSFKAERIAAAFSHANQQAAGQ